MSYYDSHRTTHCRAQKQLKRQTKKEKRGGIWKDGGSQKKDKRARSKGKEGSGNGTFPPHTPPTNPNSAKNQKGSKKSKKEKSHERLVQHGGSGLKAKGKKSTKSEGGGSAKKQKKKK